MTLSHPYAPPTIPAGSFKRIPDGRFAFEGVLDGVSLEVQIVPLGNKIFTLEADGADLNPITNPSTPVSKCGYH